MDTSENFSGETRLATCLYKLLNGMYRSFDLLDPALFPDDEFSRRESIWLVRLLNLIRDNGYSVLWNIEQCPRLSKTLDTAAQYGEFADPRLGRDFCGCFIAAELSMEPISYASYMYSMLSYMDCIPETPGNWQRQSVFLMQLARAIRWRGLETEERIPCLLESAESASDYVMPDHSVALFRRFWNNATPSLLFSGSESANAYLMMRQTYLDVLDANWNVNDAIAGFKKAMSSYGLAIERPCLKALDLVHSFSQLTNDANVLSLCRSFAARLTSSDRTEDLLEKGCLPFIELAALFTGPVQTRTYRALVVTTPYFRNALPWERRRILTLLKVAHVLRGCSLDFERRLYETFWMV